MCYCPLLLPLLQEVHVSLLHGTVAGKAGLIQFSFVLPSVSLAVFFLLGFLCVGCFFLFELEYLYENYDLLSLLTKKKKKKDLILHPFTVPFFDVR